MGCEPKFGKNFLARTDAWRHILELHPYQPRVFRHMKDAIAILGKDDDVVSGLFQELAAPVLPTDRRFPHVGWLTLQAVRRRQGEHQYGEDDVHAHRPRRFLGRMREAPLLLALLDTAMLLLIYWPRILHEEETLLRRYPSDMPLYRTIPRLVPNPWLLCPAFQSDRFSLRRAYRNLGMRSIGALLLTPLLLEVLIKLKRGR